MWGPPFVLLPQSLNKLRQTCALYKSVAELGLPRRGCESHLSLPRASCHPRSRYHALLALRFYQSLQTGLSISSSGHYYPAVCSPPVILLKRKPASTLLLNALQWLKARVFTVVSEGGASPSRALPSPPLLHVPTHSLTPHWAP